MDIKVSRDGAGPAYAFVEFEGACTLPVMLLLMLTLQRLLKLLRVLMLTLLKLLSGHDAERP
jgi:hypothetical protein